MSETRDVEGPVVDRIESCLGRINSQLDDWGNANAAREQLNTLVATIRRLRSERDELARAINKRLASYGSTKTVADLTPAEAVTLLIAKANGAAATSLNDTHRAVLFHESEKRRKLEAELERAEYIERNNVWKRRADRAEAELERANAALRALGANDWPAMIELARRLGCLPDRHGADNPAEYEWKGDHHEDARYTLPMRTGLTVAVCRALATGGDDGSVVERSIVPEMDEDSYGPWPDLSDLGRATTEPEETP